jgi:hypothetical protein
MSSKPTPVRPRSTLLRVFLWSALALAVVLPVAGGLWVYWTFFSTSLPWGPDMTGLDGAWREDNNPQHSYMFHKDGKLLWKTRALVLGDLTWTELGTWKRDGRKISILPERNWKVEGELQDDGTIRGKTYSMPEGNALGDVVWRKE